MLYLLCFSMFYFAAGSPLAVKKRSVGRSGGKGNS